MNVEPNLLVSPCMVCSFHDVLRGDVPPTTQEKPLVVPFNAKMVPVVTSIPFTLMASTVGEAAHKESSMFDDFFTFSHLHSVSVVSCEYSVMCTNVLE